MPPLQEHVAAAGGTRGRRGVGGVGRVVVVVDVVPRRAPGGRRRRRRLQRARPRRRLRVRLGGGGEVRGQSGAVGGDGRGVVVSEGSRRRLAGHAAAAATVREREAVRAESLVPATTQISDLAGTKGSAAECKYQIRRPWSGWGNVTKNHNTDRSTAIKQREIENEMTAKFDNHSLAGKMNKQRGGIGRGEHENTWCEV